MADLGGGWSLHEVANSAAIYRTDAPADARLVYAMISPYNPDDAHALASAMELAERRYREPQRKTDDTARPQQEPPREKYRAPFRNRPRLSPPRDRKPADRGQRRTP
jgi:hypothetical protein